MRLLLIPLLTLFLLCSTQLFGQQPAYFILGENQFKGVQVYDVIQDNKLNYWFATNEGLYTYDHYTYEKIECDKAKSNSVFNFVSNSKGTIYCHNLNNQIFQIKNKTCSLFYELEADEFTSDISLAVTNTDQLLIGSKKIIQLSEAGVILKRINVTRHYLGPPYKDNNAIYYHLASSDSILQIDNDKNYVKKLQFTSNGIEPNAVLKFFSLNKIVYAVNLKTKKLYTFDPKTFELKLINKNTAFEPTQSIRLYSTDGNLWLAGTLPGVIMLDKEIAPTKINSFYENYFISDVYKDLEGNILLSTFDNGILVIPDMNIPDVIHSFKDDPIRALLHDSEIGLLLGSSKGQLMAYTDQKVSTLNNTGKRPIEHLYSRSDVPFVLFDDGLIRLFNKHTKTITGLFEASLKDAVIVSDKLFYLGTNRGILKFDSKDASAFSCELLPDFTFRVYSMSLNPKDGTIYASTSKGLFYIRSNSKSGKIIYKGEDLFPNALHYNDGKIYAAEKKGGILLIENDHVNASLMPSVNGETVVLNKLIIYNKTIIAGSSKGLFQFDMSGKLLNALSISQGFSSNRIIDFIIQGDNLWVSHTNGVQQINLNKLNQKNTTPVIRLSGILVNDIERDQLTATNFSSNERKIEFILSSPTLRDRENIHYHYKLEGNDKLWTINNYESNKITYNALAPGNYIFLIKAEKQGVFSEVISYSFTIDSPFYWRWWFIALIIDLFLVTVYVVYRRQLNIQNKKSKQINELNASKLTAIQSQMNPHFIFNSLNSIQDLILKGDVEHSYSYITTFSNLVRLTLSYSDKDFIDFEQEIKLLELYLSLEQLRFKKDFAYSIETNNIVDIQIPPMLIQPFIENALVHGLLHKEGQKSLKIHFELKDVLICTIEDNGVGREKAKSIKQRQRSEHESFSGKAIHNRFEILSNVFEGQFGYSYEDLQENEKSNGTRVILNIPIKHKF